MRISEKVSILAVLLASFAATLGAQLNRATLTGIITDPSGAAVANAKIVAVARDTNTTYNTLTTCLLYTSRCV